MRGAVPRKPKAFPIRSEWRKAGRRETEAQTLGRHRGRWNAAGAFPNFPALRFKLYRCGF